MSNSPVHRAPFALLLLAGSARAQEPAAPPPGTPEAGEEIIVYDTQEIERRRQVLEAIILDQDYKEGIDKGDRTIYRPMVPWKPSVIVHDDGIVQLTRSPVRWMAPGNPDNALNNLWCLPPFTPMCVRIGGQVISGRKLQAHKHRVLEQTHQASEAWRQAIVDKSTFERVNEELPALIDATWKTGAPLEPGEPELPTHADRRQALLRFWATRSDTREGHIVARVVADYLAFEVQASAHPVTADELAQANQLAAGVRTLDLDLAADIDPGLDDAPAPSEPAPAEPAPAEPLPTPDPG